jgi:hypothetical protein
MPADGLNAYELQAFDASFFKTTLRHAEPLVSSEESERTSAVCTSGPLTGPGTRPGPASLQSPGSPRTGDRVSAENIRAFRLHGMRFHIPTINECSL